MGGGERTQGSPLPFQSKGVPDRLVEVRDGLGGGEVEVGGRGQNALRSPLWPPQGAPRAFSSTTRGPGGGGGGAIPLFRLQDLLCRRDHRPPEVTRRPSGRAPETKHSTLVPLSSASSPFASPSHFSSPGDDFSSGASTRRRQRQSSRAVPEALEILVTDAT